MDGLRGGRVMYSFPCFRLPLPIVSGIPGIFTEHFLPSARGRMYFRDAYIVEKCIESAAGPRHFLPLAVGGLRNPWDKLRWKGIAHIAAEHLGEDRVASFQQKASIHVEFSKISAQ